MGETSGPFPWRVILVALTVVAALVALVVWVV
jgi:hypothetical protein